MSVQPPAPNGRESLPRSARVPLASAAVLALALLPGCFFFDDGTETVSVFDLEPGQCLLAPDDPAVELTEMTVVPCDEPHEMEVFALLDFDSPAGASQTGAAGSTFPGDAPLKDFADGACAGAFADYVGVDYRDSRLFFTYLVPSARSWEADGDRTVTCVITTTGEPLDRSVAGSGL